MPHFESPKSKCQDLLKNIKEEGVDVLFHIYMTVKLLNYRLTAPIQTDVYHLQYITSYYNIMKELIVKRL